jgi:choline kinase
MKAIHLAAGEGTRLRPLTKNQPKPLVELGGTSLLERNVSTLDATGVDEHVVVTGHEADQIRTRGFETVHNDVYDETEMVYSLFQATEAFPAADEGDIAISYGDIVYEQRIAEALLSCDAPMCVVVDQDWRKLWEERFDEPLTDAETLSFDETNRIRSIGDSPEGYNQIDSQYTGLLKVRNDYIEPFVEAYREIDEHTDGYVSIDMTAFLQQLIDDGWHLQAVPVERGWLEVDTLDDLNQYRAMYENGNLSTFISL